MNCDEFENIGLDTSRDFSLTPAQRIAAEEHAASCPRCAALQDSWQAARTELSVFAAATSAAQAPARVEMRLRQEFRARHTTVKVRTMAGIATAVLAAAAVVVGSVAWRNWRAVTPSSVPPIHAQSAKALSPSTDDGTAQTSSAARAAESAPDSAAVSDLLVASSADDFTPLPGSAPNELDDAAIVRVRMQRATLGALGLPVNEERASDWIQVDLLVGNDGQPQAVRLSP